MTRSTRAQRLRVVLFAVVLGTSAFAVEATPTSVPLPRPEALTPQRAAALGCADEPSFEGRLTGSATSTTALTRSTSGNVYGYISKVADDWSCTSAFRYDGLEWVRNADASGGNWDWGNLINSTSVACNWAIGSTDYLKANSTTDCPDNDAEYALPIFLGYADGSTLLQAVYHNDITPDEYGDFGFIHTDCTSYYGGEKVQYSEPYASSNVGNRPGANCDPRVLESTNTTQSIVVDKTAPTLAVTAPAGSAPTVVGTT